MKLKITVIVLLSIFVFSCKNESSKNVKKEVIKPEQKTAPTFQNKGHKLVYNMVQNIGNYNTLRKKKDVVYTYTYQTPDGKADVSTEKYIFNGELSYGVYNKHERTFPDLVGRIEQGYDGNEYWLKHEGKTINDTSRLKRVAFNRPTNFYWFSMMQKLLDPSLNYEYIGEKKLNNVAYDIVKVSFNSKTDKPTDIYQLYINKETLLADQFLFTVADFGLIETPFLMTVEYEKIDGLLIPSKRFYKKSTWNANVSEDPWIKVTWSNIQFNNDLNTSDFKK
jgi:hypothetical protein